jgi:transglutaminase-like putative cysteine protease
MKSNFAPAANFLEYSALRGNFNPVLRRANAFLFLALLYGLSAHAQPDLKSIVTAAQTLRDEGDFTGAAAAYRSALNDPTLTALQRKDVAYQIDLLQRIRLDYKLTTDELFAALQKSVRDLTRAEFDRWVAEGRFDKMKIDGVDRFVDASVSNLFFRYPELNPRRLDGKNTIAQQQGRLQLARAIQKAARETGSPFVLPHHFRNTMTVTVSPEAAPDGATIRAWLPIPRKYPYQDDFSIISSAPAIKELANADSPIRSAYLEQPAQTGQPTVFSLTYGYTRWGVSFPLDPAKALPADLRDAELKPYTEEGPHVVFTPAIRALARAADAGATNPAVRAKAYYDWITANVKYSFAREYSTLTNISDYCLLHRYGDCGQEALLFITLCRSAGIPARWQSGWDMFPNAHDIHDWTEIYLAPYGWVPVDPWAGLFATQQCDALSPAERIELRDFYFGGLDPYRMAANSDHSQTLQPAKRSARSDDVDFQRGELETGDTNIYFDKYTYHLEVEETHEAR